mgnify:CR=1
MHRQIIKPVLAYIQAKKETIFAKHHRQSRTEWSAKKKNCISA